MAGTEKRQKSMGNGNSKSKGGKTKNRNKKEGIENSTVTSILKNAPASLFPKELSSMLATLVDEPFDDEDWEFERKWDGYRTLETGIRKRYRYDGCIKAPAIVV